MNQQALELEEIAQKNQRRKQVEINENLEKLSEYLDELFRIPGTKWRFGFDAIVSLIPNFGDTLTTIISLYILIAGVRYGVPKITLLRMAMNVAIDYLVGSIPFIGDAFDFFWKSNKRNIELIKERATANGAGTLGDYIFVFGIIGLLIMILIGSIIVSIYLIELLFESLQVASAASCFN
jgi:hypothetical protein